MTEPPIDTNSFSPWIGRGQEVFDLIGPGPAAGLAALLGRDDPPLALGDALPAGAQWCYCLDRAPQAALGEDGHAARGGFLPPVALPRRMWAGGRIDYGGPLFVGDGVTRRSRVVDIQGKQGRAGPLVFVTVRHEFSGVGGLAVSEEHDIVYRGEPAPGAPSPPPQTPPQDARWRRQITPGPVMLFRYSALTFNGHRIHYDAPYATGREGYPGLVVHGPLIATLLMDLCAGENPGRAIRHFRFRAVAPLFDTAPFSIAGRPDEAGNGGIRLWAETPDGGLAMDATAHLDDGE